MTSWEIIPVKITDYVNQGGRQEKMQKRFLPQTRWLTGTQMSGGRLGCKERMLDIGFQIAVGLMVNQTSKGERL